MIVPLFMKVHVGDKKLLSEVMSVNDGNPVWQWISHMGDLNEFLSRKILWTLHVGLSEVGTCWWKWKKNKNMQTKRWIERRKHGLWEVILASRKWNSWPQWERILENRQTGKNVCLEDEIREANRDQVSSLYNQIKTWKQAVPMNFLLEETKWDERSASRVFE